MFPAVHAQYDEEDVLTPEDQPSQQNNKPAEDFLEDDDDKFDFGEDTISEDPRIKSLEADKNLTETEKETKMLFCLETARSRLVNEDDEKVKEFVTSFSKQLTGIEDRQILEYLHMEVIKNCYLEGDINTIKAGGDSADAMLFPSVGTRNKNLHKSQWDILNSVLEKQRKTGRAKIEMDVFGSKMSYPMKIGYMIVVLLFVFGIAYWLVLQLTKMERKRKLTREERKNKKKDK
jgi:hypothetical protein